MNLIRNYNDKNIGCALLEFAGKYSQQDSTYEADVISASLGKAYFFWC